MTTPPLIFDRALRRLRLARAAQLSGRLGGGEFLRARAAEDAAERLAAIMRRFPVAVDMGSGGTLPAALAEAGAGEKVGLWIKAEAATSRLPAAEARAVIDDEALPFAPESLDLFVSTLALHWTNDLVGALVQIRRSLRPDGLFMGSLFGGATLTELRQSLMIAEEEIHGGAGPRVSPFADGFDGGALLQRAGFKLPVSDVDRITVRYEHPLKLMADLRAMGETNVLKARSRRPLTRTVVARTMQVYAERFALPDGRIPATFEIITLTGWAAHESQQVPLKPGSAKTRLADALGAVERPLERE